MKIIATAVGTVLVGLLVFSLISHDQQLGKKEDDWAASCIFGQLVYHSSAHSKKAMAVNAIDDNGRVIKCENNPNGGYDVITSNY